LAPFANPPIRVGLADRFSFRRVLSFPIERRSPPPLRWPAVIAGAAVAVIASALGGMFLAPILGGAVTIIGIGIGGFVAGKWAKIAGAYHGALAAVGWIVVAALGLVPTPGYGSNVLADTVVIIVFDVIALAIGSLGGMLARPDQASSSDTGRGR
jgi:hypothetical protein